MRSALMISLGLHLLVSLVAVQWVRFREVNFIPRQVYAVDLVTAAEMEAEKPPARVEPEPAPPEPEEKQDEMEPPPVEPQKPRKKPKKETKKTVPTTQLEKTQPKPDLDPENAQQAMPETGEMAFDADDFPFAHYIGRMRRKIAAHWRVPEGSQGEERFCRIYFRVHRDGSVTSVGIEQSSGLFIFDQAAQRAVHQASPMPPLPQEYNEEYLGVHFSFSYKER